MNAFVQSSTQKIYNKQKSSILLWYHDLLNFSFNFEISHVDRENKIFPILTLHIDSTFKLSECIDVWTLDSIYNFGCNIKIRSTHGRKLSKRYTGW